MQDSRIRFVYLLVKISSNGTIAVYCLVSNALCSRHAQILENSRLLLVVTDRYGRVFIYLDSLAGMDGAIKRNKHKVLHRDKMGQEFLLAYDESKRMLALCASTKVWTSLLLVVAY